MSQQSVLNILNRNKKMLNSKEIQDRAKTCKGSVNMNLIRLLRSNDIWYIEKRCSNGKMMRYYTVTRNQEFTIK